jgi:hypothetical protein
MSDNLPAPVPSSRLTERMTYAKALAHASLLPRAYRDQPANVLLAMEYGDALGLSPIAAIQGVHVIDGKPTASASLIGALVRRAGHRLRVETSPDGTSATATIIRADDPDFPFTCTWTMDRARAAGLLGKSGGSWSTYPQAMLKARAITEVARDACPEVLSGVAYTAEELGADDHAPTATATWETPEPVPAPDGVDTDTGEIVDAEIVDEVVRADSSPGTGPVGLPDPDGSGVGDALPTTPLPSHPDGPTYLPGPAGRAQGQPGTATATQVRKLAAVMAHHRITNHVLAEYCRDRLGFTLPADLNQLDKRQASAIITALTTVVAP